MLNWGPKYGYIWLPSCLLTALWIYFYFPETKDRTLEEIDELVSLPSCVALSVSGISANVFNKQFESRVPARKFRKYQCTGAAAHGGGKLSGDEETRVEEHVEDAKH